MKKVSSLLVSTFLLFSLPQAFAGVIDHFEVVLDPTTSKVGEALDITIEAVDRDNNTVTNYDGSILVFSESDAEAEFPNELEENSYTFTPSDQGKVKFENAVIFKNAGKQDIHVYDLDDDNIMGLAEVEITDNAVEEIVEINILSPETGVTVGESKVTVSGTSKKNHQIHITINDAKDIPTTTNSEGVFEKEITDFETGKNTIQAKILNADNEVIGTSNIVTITIDDNTPRLNKISIKPSAIVEADTTVTAEVYANKGLTEVQIIVNDNINTLSEEETEPGKYTGIFRAPKTPGKYAIDVILKDELGHETTEKEATSIMVQEATLASADTEETDTPEVAVETSEEPKVEKPDLTITGLKVVTLKSKSVITWDEIEAATGYRVYKKLENGEMELVEEVTEPRFSLEITGDEITHDYFAVSAYIHTETGATDGSGSLNSAGAEPMDWEGDLSAATKVQTGPEIYILLIIALLISGLLFFTRRKQA
ncbi:MAG: hypothetical protein H6767_03335 [Candidatus Peribacteria bacterium]|nr:MAG: hypothetical protein H6767_03335 [Candidatus Peribacteria bacterium]